ncbi:hypothetical protein ColKHC_06119 [Colletotrichum higginsianum]|nr:hypothetical protein ColKHC_06119 [Colletotrichum higginsianum]
MFSSMTSAVFFPSSDWATVTWKRGHNEAFLRKRFLIIVVSGEKPVENGSGLRRYDAIGVQNNETRDFLGIEEIGQKVDNQNARRDAEYATAGVHLFSRANTGEVSVDDREAPGAGGHADRGVLSQRLSNPVVFAIIGPDKNNEVVACSVVGMKQIRHEPHQTQTAGEDHQLIFIPQLLEEALLVFLGDNNSTNSILKGFRDYLQGVVRA